MSGGILWRTIEGIKKKEINLCNNKFRVILTAIVEKIIGKKIEIQINAIINPLIN